MKIAGMSREMKVGDRVRVRTWTGMPEYFLGDRGTVLRYPEIFETGEPCYLVAMDKDAGKGTALFTADEIEPDVG